MVGFAARLFVGVLFLVAAVSKLQIRGWSTQTARAMRLPLAPVRATPGAELVVGAALVAGVPLAPLAAIVMLVAYTAVLVPRVGGPPCACFGRAAKPITRWTIGRNVALLALCIVSVTA